MGYTSMEKLGKQIQLISLLGKYAEIIHTDEGKTYYQFPGYFEIIPGDFHVVLHNDKFPEDLGITLAHINLGRPYPPDIPLLTEL